MVAAGAAAVENTFVGLKNTVCFDLRGSARAVGKISVQDWMRFLQVDAGVDLSKVEQALLHTITGGLFVEMNTEELYEEVLRKAEAGVPWSKQAGAMVYGWSAGEDVTSLHLNNVFTSSDMEAIRVELRKYGVIVAEQRQFYKDYPAMKTGVVTVKMRLRPEVVVPTYLLEERVGNTVQVFSDRHMKLCHRCLEHGHLTAFCRKPVKSRQAASKSKTWAMVASARSSSSEVSVSDTTVSGPSTVIIQERDPQSKSAVLSVPEVPSVVVGQSKGPAQITENQITAHRDEHIVEKMSLELKQAQVDDIIEEKGGEKTKSVKRMARSLSPKSKQQLEEKKTRIMEGLIDRI